MAKIVFEKETWVAHGPGSKAEAVYDCVVDFDKHILTLRGKAFSATGKKVAERDAQIPFHEYNISPIDLEASLRRIFQETLHFRGIWEHSRLRNILQRMGYIPMCLRDKDMFQSGSVRIFLPKMVGDQIHVYYDWDWMPKWKGTSREEALGFIRDQYPEAKPIL